MYVLRKQALMFSADMRLDDEDVPKRRREEFVESILTVSLLKKETNLTCNVLLRCFKLEIDA